MARLEYAPRANRIAELRAAKGVTQTQLAKAIGATLSMVGKLERGERSLKEDWIRRIARALDCLPGDLFERAGHPNSMSVTGFIQHVEVISRGVGFAAGVGEMEIAGKIISYLAANPDKLDAFIEGGTFAWPHDWFENGCLSWHAMDGRIVRPEEARAARAAKREAK